MNDQERIAALMRKVAANEGGIRCGVCARDVVGLASICTQCEAPCHTDCWDYNGGCAVYGCKAAPRDPLRVDIAALKNPPPSRRWAALAAAAALVALGSYSLLTDTCHPPAQPQVTRATGSFTVRVGAPSTAGAPELQLETRILVASATEISYLHLTPGPLPRPIGGVAEAWRCLLDTAEKRGTARTVAAPTLVAQQNHDLYVRVGKSLMFTGRAEATREPTSLELHLRPTAVTDTGVTLEVQGSTTEIPYGVPTLVQVTQRAPTEQAFWNRWELKNTPDQVVAIVVTPHKAKR